jgi:hypothetical protein
MSSVELDAMFRLQNGRFCNISLDVASASDYDMPLLSFTTVDRKV